MSTLANANVNDNPDGRFKAGNKGGPGNPFAGRVAWFRQMMLECVTKEDIQAVVKSLVEMAKEGHWQAAKLILLYTIGKPQPPADLGTAFDGEPPLSPAPEGEGPHPPEMHPSPQPLSPEYRGEGLMDQEPPPSPNGEIPEPPPSTNGVPEPPRNRQERRAQRKAYRLAKQQRNTPQPAPAL